MQQQPWPEQYHCKQPNEAIKVRSGKSAASGCARTPRPPVKSKHADRRSPRAAPARGLAASRHGARRGLFSQNLAEGHVRRSGARAARQDLRGRGHKEEHAAAEQSSAGAKGGAVQMLNLELAFCSPLPRSAHCESGSVECILESKTRPAATCSKHVTLKRCVTWSCNSDGRR